MGIDMDVTTRQSECYPGDVVEGTVKLTITAVSSCASHGAGVNALHSAVAIKRRVEKRLPCAGSTC